MRLFVNEILLKIIRSLYLYDFSTISYKINPNDLGTGAYDTAELV